MPDTNGFTVKEMLLTISNKLDAFIETDKVEKKEIDNRLDTLEQHRSAIMSNFKLAAWLIGAGGGIGGLVGLLNWLGS
jgi:hypothetical protein